MQITERALGIPDKRSAIAPQIGRIGLQVAVFASIEAVSGDHLRDAARFGQLSAASGHTLIRGAVDRGLLKAVAEPARTSNTPRIAIAVEGSPNDFQKSDGEELLVVADVAARRREMLARADAVVVLAGGVGTYDEATTAMELKRWGRFPGPITFLNTGEFYAGMELQLRTAEQHGMLPMSLDDMVHFAPTPESAIDYINSYPVSQTHAS